jgi:ABC-type transport system involved in cytochrome c biogenesis permease subunit
MNWINFPIFAAIAALLWFAGIFLVNISGRGKNPEKAGRILIVAGLAVMISFVCILWKHLGRPPMRTLGETRLWYSIFLPLVGMITYLRWGYRWFITYALLLAMLFLFINFLHPETHEKTLMFIPHVIVYIFSYALLAASSLVAVKGLYQLYFREIDLNTLHLADNLVYVGFSFLTLGLLFGALWAKKAWGHYWTWDPKETWAFLTWLIYLIYMHFRTFQPKRTKAPLWILSLAFVVLLVCWFGINYLPSAQNSVHVYAR